MIDVKGEIVKQLDVLPYEWQCHVLDFTRALTKAVSTGVPGRHLLRFSGTIRADDLKTMEQAIENGCERIDMDEW